MILAFDIGGSRIRAAVWDGSALQSLGSGPTPASDRQAIVDQITGFAAGRMLSGLAISIAGVVDPATGIGKVANIPAIDGIALAPLLTEATGLPALILNDADCFALAEARLGAGRGHRSVFGVVLGSGVGGGLVIDGKVITGAGGYAGEWGHGPVIRGEYAFPCGCGQVGCLDMVSSARGIERLHKALTAKVLRSEEIIAHWQAGDAHANATLSLWRDLVAGPLAMVLNVVGASVVPVGGGLGLVPDLVAYLDTAVRAAVLRATDKPLLVPAECGADAGILGAAMAAAAEWG